MLMFLWICIYILVLVGAECPTGWTVNAISGKCYSADLGMMGHADCESQCYDNDSGLLCIENSSDNEFLYGYTSSQITWIGYNEIANPGSWVWPAGCNSGYVNWRSGQPSGIEGCTVLSFMYSNTWDDNYCDIPAHCYCEMYVTSSVLQSNFSTNPTVTPTSKPTVNPTVTPTFKPTAIPIISANCTNATESANLTLTTSLIKPTLMRSRMPPFAELYDRANTPATKRQQPTVGSSKSASNAQAGDEIKSKINKMREKVAVMRGEL
jgi:hypothetical protein